MSSALLTAITVAVVVYIALCAALYLFQERLIFFPEVLAPGYSYDFPAKFDEVTWQVDGATIHALHFRVDQPKGAILYLRGNAGSLRSWGAIASTFVAQGYEVLIPDYRGFGKSTSRITSEQALYDDALAGYAFLQGHFPEDRIVVYGRSLGTALAAFVASKKQPRMLILETPYFSLRELARRQFPFVPTALLKYPLRTDRWLPEVTCTVYLFHGTRDELVPYSSSLRLLPLIKAEHELITIEGGGHNNLADFAQYHDALERLLK